MHLWDKMEETISIDLSLLHRKRGYLFGSLSADQISESYELKVAIDLHELCLCSFDSLSLPFPKQLHSLLFINLGSILSLPNYFESSSDPSPEDSGAHPLPDHCTVHVIDSHRPWNLDNLFASSTILQNQIWIWDDGEVQERLQLEQEAYSELEFDRGDESESESDSEDESESESGSESGSESEDESEKEDEEEDDQDQEGDEDEFGSPSKKKVKKRKRRNDDGSDEDEDLEEGAGKVSS